MVDIDILLTELGDALNMCAGSRENGVAVRVTSAVIDIPAELGMTGEGKLLGSLPRGRLATGFMNPLGSIRAVFEEKTVL